VVSWQAFGVGDTFFCSPGQILSLIPDQRPLKGCTLADDLGR
jgi:hypothetical protein